MSFVIDTESHFPLNKKKMLYNNNNNKCLFIVGFNTQENISKLWKFITALSFKIVSYEWLL